MRDIWVSTRDGACQANESGRRRQVPRKKFPTACAQVVGVRSVLWPGAVAVAGPGAAAHACFYVGWGTTAAPFLPPPPPPVPDEYAAELVESAELPVLQAPEPVVDDAQPPDEA